MVTSSTCQFYPQKLHNLTGFFGTSFYGNWFSIQEVMSFFSKIIEQIHYFSDPPASLMGVSFFIF